MRRSSKIFFSLLSLMALGYVGLTAFGLYRLIWFRAWPYPMWPEGELMGMIGFWATALLGLATGLLALGLLIRALFVRTRHRSILLNEVGKKGQGGQVRITESSVVSCVETSLARYPQIVDVAVRPSLIKKSDGNRIRLRIHAGVPDHGSLTDLVESIQNTVRHDVEAYTGLALEKIDIKLNAVDHAPGPKVKFETPTGQDQPRPEPAAPFAAAHAADDPPEERPLADPRTHPEARNPDLEGVSDQKPEEKPEQQGGE